MASAQPPALPCCRLLPPAEGDVVIGGDGIPVSGGGPEGIVEIVEIVRDDALGTRDLSGNPPGLRPVADPRGRPGRPSHGLSPIHHLSSGAGPGRTYRRVRTAAARTILALRRNEMCRPVTKSASSSAPTTATPSALPSWREELSTPAPTPAYPARMSSMNAVVSGVIVNPAPIPMGTRRSSIAAMGVPWPKARHPNSPPARTSRPATSGERGP